MSGHSARCEDVPARVSTAARAEHGLLRFFL